MAPLSSEVYYWPRRHQLLQVNVGKCLRCAEKDHGRPSSFIAHAEVQKFKSCCRISRLNSHNDVTMSEWGKNRGGWEWGGGGLAKRFFFFQPSLAFLRIMPADLSADSSPARVPNAKMSSDHTLIFPHYSERDEMKTVVPFLQETRLGTLNRREAQQCVAARRNSKGCTSLMGDLQSNMMRGK